ncbi:hypothetical protein GGQ85_003634 [Nitrobacter vulgaris]|uniref:hypothetical protein n=1 Tax=Nitrobacter vulgaris TaxID=29421 RepID=UPI00285CFCDF|nr:hypothetical protein [Nitrobacter vulgaris]MDR6305908.1 hypothetical protein [Nitrobacter vulgaris]
MAEPRDLAEYQTDHDLLIRVNTLMETMANDIKEMKSHFVTQSEFWPVKVLVYGCAGMILTSVIGALLYLVIRQ